MPSERLDTVFRGFENLKVLVVGDVMVDAYIWGDVDRVSPEAPVPVVNTTGKEYRLGGAANVALNLISLGATPVLCSVIGADYEGDRFIQRLKMRNISSKGILKSSSRPTTVKTRVLSGYQHIVRIDSETNNPLNPADEKELLKKVMELIPDTDVIIFEDYDKGVLTENNILKILRRAQELRIPTIVDPKQRNFLAFTGVTVFKPNLKELRDGLKIFDEFESITDISLAVDQLTKLVDVEEVYLTLSEQGVLAKSKGKEVHVPAHLRTISDVSGAGDTVICILALCKGLGLNLRFTAELSNIGGGLVCEHVGVVPVDRQKLYAEAVKYGIEEHL